MTDQATISQQKEILNTELFDLLVSKAKRSGEEIFTFINGEEAVDTFGIIAEINDLGVVYHLDYFSQYNFETSQYEDAVNDFYKEVGGCVIAIELTESQTQTLTKKIDAVKNEIDAELELQRDNEQEEAHEQYLEDCDPYAYRGVSPEMFV